MAVGVLAVAVPLVFATLAGAGETNTSARAETRCTWIVPACLDELQASRLGRSGVIEKTDPAGPVPASGEHVILAFSHDGRLLGDLDDESYASGVRTAGASGVRYIASIRGRPVTGRGEPWVNVRIRLEYPAAAPAGRRKKLDFHTRLP